VATTLLTTTLLTTTVQTVPNPNKVSPGFAGFLVVFLIAIATIMLVRSMTKHLRRVRYSPDPAAPEQTQAQFRD
jgi:hypothetical protein